MTGAVFACLLRLHEASLAEALPRDELSGIDAPSSPLVDPPCIRRWAAWHSYQPVAHCSRWCEAAAWICYFLPTVPGSPPNVEASEVTHVLVLCCPADAGRPSRASAGSGGAVSGGLSVRDIVLDAEQPVCSSQQPGFSGVQVSSLPAQAAKAGLCSQVGAFAPVTDISQG